MKLDSDKITEIIQKELIKTESSIIFLKELTKPISPDSAIGRISRMDAINNKSINEAALREAEIKLAGLKHALNSVNDDNFGICARCEQTIPLGRIMLVPHSRFCANCAD